MGYPFLTSHTSMEQEVWEVFISVKVPLEIKGNFIWNIFSIRNSYKYTLAYTD